MALDRMYVPHPLLWHHTTDNWIWRAWTSCRHWSRLPHLTLTLHVSINEWIPCVWLCVWHWHYECIMSDSNCSESICLPGFSCVCRADWSEVNSSQCSAMSDYVCMDRKPLTSYQELISKQDINSHWIQILILVRCSPELWSVKARSYFHIYCAASVPDD